MVEESAPPQPQPPQHGPLDGGVCLPVDEAQEVAAGCRFCPPVRRSELLPAWHPPDNPGDTTGLHVHNSLTRSKERFVAGSGRRVRWYTCGPTVYDSAHMGHARAYLTFDILRRVMEDYFGYAVEYQLNVTDIDDKIILRARRNKLLADYRAANQPWAQVLAEVDTAVAAFERKVREKLAALEAPMPAGSSPMEADERQELLQVHRLKLTQWAAAQALIAERRAGSSAEALIGAASEPLAELLDLRLGATVTEQAVFEAHARKYEAEFLRDMEALGVRPPSLLTRVTEFVPQIVAFIEAIVAKGLAYAAGGSVYMDIERLKAAGHDYRKLMPAPPGAAANTTEAQMTEGEGELSSSGGAGAAGNCAANAKRARNDFALWKASKPGEPSWPSPWGGGRPGWHIECSVMGSATFGSNMDVHAGGADLKFPHHDNELAQSEAYHGCQQWVNFFLHAGHLHIDGLKMSKSLKNFVTIEQALAQHSPRQLRLMFLLQPWHRPMSYSEATLAEARRFEAKLKDFFGLARRVHGSAWLQAPTAPGPGELALSARVTVFRERAHAALLDNFGTPLVLHEMALLCAHATEYVRAGGAGVLQLTDAAVAVTRLLRVFGVAEQEDFGLPLGAGSGAAGGSHEASVRPFAQALVGLRDELRALAKASRDAGLLALCDKVRDELLVALGVRLEDGGGAEQQGQGQPASSWRLDDPAVLRAEAQARSEGLLEREREKAAQQLLARRKELEKLRLASVPPALLFASARFAARFSPEALAQLQPGGVPACDLAGQPLSGSARKACEKELAKQLELHKAFLAKPADCLEQLQAQVAASEQQLADLERRLLDLQAASAGGSGER